VVEVIRERRCVVQAE